ncbi:MAG: thioredoxin family protein [Mariniphaga sp.]|nr:thioredoxin family protein [Mariniphaga sp.]MDD4227635.1 thioredoxin family protein [Mariniphaga sp.]MDD4425462.1 thioredoxin family protein [Mariniphaga sp.]
MFRQIESLDEFNRLVQETPALLAYFSTDACNVCKVLKPKTGELIRSEFQQIETVYIKIDTLPEVAGQNQIFSVPTILVYFEGRETIRKSRHISLDELRNLIQRPYSIIFSR